MHPVTILLAQASTTGAAPASQPSFVFYQVTASGFVVLLLTGMLAEVRAIRDASRSQPMRPVLGSAGITLGLLIVIVVSAFTGETVDLVVLFGQRASTAPQVIVAVCFGLALVAIVLVSFGPMWEAARVWHVSLRALALALVATVTVVVVLSTSGTTYRIYGTCASGACGLNERSAPTSQSKKLGTLSDGDRVEVVCQTTGERLPGANGATSSIWDRLDNGAYVSDVYVDTPATGAYSSGLSGCPKPRGSGAG